MNTDVDFGSIAPAELDIVCRRKTGGRLGKDEMDGGESWRVSIMLRRIRRGLAIGGCIFVKRIGRRGNEVVSYISNTARFRRGSWGL